MSKNLEELNKIFEEKTKICVKQIKDFLKKASDSDLDEVALALLKYDEEYGVDCFRPWFEGR